MYVNYGLYYLAFYFVTRFELPGRAFFACKSDAIHCLQGGASQFLLD